MIRISGGRFKGRKLFSSASKLRPTSSMLRQALFNILQNEIADSHFLDLFAGTGAIGIEALSRGASFAAFVENDKSSLHNLKKNISQLKVENETFVLFKDAFASPLLLQKKGYSFDIIFIDPPYPLFSSHPEKILMLLISCASLLKTGGSLFLEHPSRTKPFILKELELIKSRKSGLSALTHYRKA